MLFFSGATDVGFIDPVAIGRNVFNVTNDFVSGIAENICGVVNTIMDVILDTIQGTVSVTIRDLQSQLLPLSGHLHLSNSTFSPSTFNFVYLSIFFLD